MFVVLFPALQRERHDATLGLSQSPWTPWHKDVCCLQIEHLQRKAKKSNLACCCERRGHGVDISRGMFVREVCVLASSACVTERFRLDERAQEAS